MKEGHSSNTLLLVVILVVSVITLLLVLLQSYSPRSMMAEAAIAPEYTPGGCFNACMDQNMGTPTCENTLRCLDNCGIGRDQGMQTNCPVNKSGSCVDATGGTGATICSAITDIRTCTQNPDCNWSR